jgi:ABC-type sugar transport system ATPase subunit
VGGEHLKKLSPRILKAHHVGMAPEDRKRQGLVLVFPVLENLTLASLYRAAPQGVIQRQVETGLAEDMVRDLQIKTASLGVKTRTLSGGNQQKVVIGNWLNTQPKVLILDEPTRGIDIQAKEQIFSLVRELAAEGMAVLFISSEIEEVLDVADRIVVMNNGRLTHEVTPGETTLENLLSLLMEEIPHG